MQAGLPKLRRLHILCPKRLSKLGVSPPPHAFSRPPTNREIASQPLFLPNLQIPFASRQTCPPLLSSYSFTTVLLTGGASGLGRALAEHLLSKDKNVIIAGRTESKLKATVAEIGNDKLSYVVLDTSNVASFSGFISMILQEYPELDCVIHNAGIQKPVNYVSGDPEKIIADTESELQTNINGPVHLTARLLPHLLSKPSAAIFTVSSGLAFVPLASVPVYCATKSFIHQWTMSLREQLKETSVKVFEIIPPLVGTDLHRDHSDPDNNKPEKNKMALSVEDFIGQVAGQMDEGRLEIAPGFAEGLAKKWHETYDEILEGINLHEH